MRCPETLVNAKFRTGLAAAPTEVGPSPGPSLRIVGFLALLTALEENRTATNRKLFNIVSTWRLVVKWFLFIGTQT
jgi:hypothetical protein